MRIEKLGPEFIYTVRTDWRGHPHDTYARGFVSLLLRYASLETRMQRVTSGMPPVISVRMLGDFQPVS